MTPTPEEPTRHPDDIRRIAELENMVSQLAQRLGVVAAGTTDILLIRDARALLNEEEEDG